VSGASTREIPRSEWVSFFDAFSRQHEDWLVTLELQETNQAPRVEAREVPLEGITADLKAGQDSVSIITAHKDQEYISHRVPQATRVRLLESQAGVHEGLEIESQDGTKAVLRFRSPMPPETVDGIVT
jgi:hypothetical protein